jgi:anti-sigma factor RsiW
MSAPCAAPLPWSRLVDYWAGDPDAAESDRIEEHLFGCAACSTQLARLAGVAEALRTAIPSVVAPDQVPQLRASRGSISPARSASR